MNGVHHFLLSSIPMSVQYGAVISTIAVEVVVTTVVVNFLATMWGKGHALRSNLPIRWFFTGMVFYFITCLQCAFQVTLTFQGVIRMDGLIMIATEHLLEAVLFAFANAAHCMGMCGVFAISSVARMEATRRSRFVRITGGVILLGMAVWVLVRSSWMMTSPGACSRCCH